MSSERGGALLAMLWLSAVLAAIAFSVSTTVRGEIERTATETESVQAYYLAQSGIERAMMYIELGPGVRLPDNRPRYWEPNTAKLEFDWPAGKNTVEFIPESSKFDINNVNPQEFTKLLLALGIDAGRATEITNALVDWRTQAPPGTFTMFDQAYQSVSPTFRARHASIEEIEEVLLVKGMTPDIFYGSFARDPQARLIPQAGVRDCVSVFGTTGPFDINTVNPAVLTAIGVPPGAVDAIEKRRRAKPFRDGSELPPFAAMAGAPFSRITIGGGSIYSFRSTARLKTPNNAISDLSRTVMATVKFHKQGVIPPTEVLRWYEH